MDESPILRRYEVTIFVRESSSSGSIALFEAGAMDGVQTILACTGPAALSVLDMVVDEIVKREVGVGITDDEGWLE